MPIRIFLRLTALTTAIIGVSLICLPQTLVNIFLPAHFGNGTIFVRFLGSALFGYAVMNAYASKYSHLVLVKANLMGNFATLSVAFIISVVGVMVGSLNSYGILIVLLHVVFGAGFGWYLYQMRHPRASNR